jgi:hypothetical protein
MKFERRLHNGKWAAYVRVLGIWWFIRDFDNAKKAGYFISIAMGQNILRPRKEKKATAPALEEYSGDGPYRVGSEILVTAIQNPFDDTKKWPMAELPNGTIARITCMPDGCVYIPYGAICRARITGITSQSASVAVLQIFE